MLRTPSRSRFIVLALLAWESIAGGRVLLAQPARNPKAEELIRSAQQHEMIAYIVAGVGVLMVAAVIPVAMILKRRARIEGDEANSKGARARPYWVKLALWGVPSRAAAWLYFWAAVAIAAGCTALGFVEPVFFVGGMILLAALWYYAAIQWVDQHGNWS